MAKQELVYYAILLIGPALFFLAILIFTKPQTKKRKPIKFLSTITLFSSSEE